ncbi:MAG: chemotaxis protein CheC [Acidobacteriota bacterium]|jgi:chemotaxis protein CheC
MFSKLSENELDALKEVSNVGAGHAVTALHQMTQRTIMLEVPQVRLVPFSKVSDALGGPEEEVLGLFIRVFGDSRGNMLAVMPRKAADHLIQILFNGKEGRRALGEMEISALKEVGNIIGSAYLSAVSGILNISLIPSIPAFSMDMAQAVVDLLLIELAEVSNEALVIQTEFRSRDGRFQGHLFLLPDPGSIDTMLQGIRAAISDGGPGGA